MKTLPRFWFETRPWVDGVWQPTDGTIAVRNPATGAVLAEVGRADERLVTRAIDGAGFFGLKLVPPRRVELRFGG